MKSRYKITYETDGKRPKKKESKVNINDKVSGTTKSLSPVDKLGDGTYGIVRLFSHENKRTHIDVAVKQLQTEFTTNLSTEKKDEEKALIEKEFAFTKRAHPEDEFYSIHHFEQKTGKDRWNYSFRMTMPFIPGKKPRSFAHKDLHTTHDIAKLFLRIAEKVHQLHQIGIIHGDIGNRNMLVRFNETQDDLLVTMIDFGKSYDINDDAPNGYEHDDSGGKDDGTFIDNEFAPELYQDTKIYKAHPAQDIYPLGNTFKYILTKFSDDWSAYFLKKYPPIKNFIKQSHYTNPDKRPTLTAFIDELKPIIDWESTITPTMQQLILTMRREYPHGARKLLEADARHYPQKELLTLLDTIILHEDYELAAKLTLLRNRLPLNHLSREQAAILHLHRFIIKAADSEVRDAAIYIATQIDKATEIDTDSDDYRKYLAITQTHTELSDIIEELQNADVIEITNHSTCVIN